MSAPTRAVRYNTVQPATMLTVQLHKTIPYTKCMTECQQKFGTYARSSTQHVNSMLQHKDWPGITKPSQTGNANSRPLPTWRIQSRLLPPSLKTQPKLLLTWEVQSKPLSSLEVQCGTSKQPMKACPIDSVPATCKKDYKAITTSFKQGQLSLPNQPTITVTPSPVQRPGKDPCQPQLSSIQPHTGNDAQE